VVNASVPVCPKYILWATSVGCAAEAPKWSLRLT
jgi:hypothetical protein